MKVYKMFPQNTIKLVEMIIEKAGKKGLTIATAESCTGGLIIGALTEVSGSSAVVDRGFITYTNQSKVDMVNVKPTTLEKYGAVSKETVREMAKGAQKISGCHITVAVSGVAGPTGGTAEKPVGLVHFAFCFGAEIKNFHHIFKGSRQEVRAQTIKTALKEILSYLS